MEHFKKAKSFDFMRVNMKVPKILFKKVSLTCTTQSKYNVGNVVDKDAVMVTPLIRTWSTCPIPTW